MTPELPDYRVTFNHPFEVVGVDCANPDICSSNNDVHKCQILLFTCGFSQAVHLEVTSDIGADNSLLALKRFISRRGLNLFTKFISDNAKTFKTTKLKLLLNGKNTLEIAP